jgi:hypothetical protein
MTTAVLCAHSARGETREVRAGRTDPLLCVRRVEISRPARDMPRRKDNERGPYARSFVSREIDGEKGNLLVPLEREGVHIPPRDSLFLFLD